MSTSNPFPDEGNINDVITNAKLDFCIIHRNPNQNFTHISEGAIINVTGRCVGVGTGGGEPGVLLFFSG